MCHRASWITDEGNIIQQSEANFQITLFQIIKHFTIKSWILYLSNTVYNPTNYFLLHSLTMKFYATFYFLQEQPVKVWKNTAAPKQG